MGHINLKMKITIVIDGHSQERIIPTSWAEVSFRLFLNLVPAKDDFLQVFSILTGIPPEVLRKAKIINMDSVLSLLGFLRQYTNPPVPSSILGYAIPNDLGLETLGQYVDLKDEFEKAIKELPADRHLEKYPLYCAVYACKAKHGEYDWQKAQAMADEFMDAPALEVLAVGNFTVKKLSAWMLGLSEDYQQASTPSKNGKPALKSSPKPMASMGRSSTSKKKRPLRGTKS